MAMAVVTFGHPTSCYPTKTCQSGRQSQTITAGAQHGDQSNQTKAKGEPDAAADADAIGVHYALHRKRLEWNSSGQVGGLWRLG